MLRLYPPYSTAAGTTDTEVGLDRPIAAEAFFDRYCGLHPALLELFFPSGSVPDFPGYTSVLRDGLALKTGDLIRPGDVLLILTALSGG